MIFFNRKDRKPNYFCFTSLQKIFGNSSIKHFCNHFEINQILHSCEALGEKKIVIAVFLEFRRAFKTVNHKILLDELNMAAVKDNALQWMTSYLQDRQ